MIIFFSLFLAASASVKSGKWNWEPAPPTTTTSTTTTTTTPITTTKWTGPPHLDPALKRSPWIPPLISSDKRTDPTPPPDASIGPAGPELATLTTLGGGGAPTPPPDASIGPAGPELATLTTLGGGGAPTPPPDASIGPAGPTLTTLTTIPPTRTIKDPYPRPSTVPPPGATCSPGDSPQLEACFKDQPQFRNYFRKKGNKTDENTYCYHWGTTPKNWWDAFDRCQNDDGHLASIHDEGEGYFLWTVTKNKMIQNGHKAYWIDGKKLAPPEHEEWIWTDGTTLCHQFFCPGSSIGAEPTPEPTPAPILVPLRSGVGEPHSHKNNCLNFGGCTNWREIAMKEENCMGWKNDVDCKTKLPFICKKALKKCSLEKCI